MTPQRPETSAPEPVAPERIYVYSWDEGQLYASPEPFLPSDIVYVRADTALAAARERIEAVDRRWREVDADNQRLKDLRAHDALKIDGLQKRLAAARERIAGELEAEADEIRAADGELPVLEGFRAAAEFVRQGGSPDER